MRLALIFSYSDVPRRERWSARREHFEVRQRNGPAVTCPQSQPLNPAMTPKTRGTSCPRGTVRAYWQRLSATTRLTVRKISSLDQWLARGLVGIQREGAQRSEESGQCRLHCANLS